MYCNGSSNTLWINQDLLRLYTFKMALFMWYQLCLSQENPNQTEFLLKKKKTTNIQQMVSFGLLDHMTCCETSRISVLGSNSFPSPAQCQCPGELFGRRANAISGHYPCSTWLAWEASRGHTKVGITLTPEWTQSERCLCDRRAMHPGGKSSEHSAWCTHL